MIGQKTKSFDGESGVSPGATSPDRLSTTPLARSREDVVAARASTTAHEQVSCLVQPSFCILMSPSNSTFWDDVAVSYTIKNLCAQPLGLVYGHFLPLNSCSSYPPQMMVSRCLLAMAKIYYGLRTRETRSLRTGIHLYGQGLRMINGVLNNRHGTIATETIVSVVSLCISEVGIFSPSSYISHSCSLLIVGVGHDAN